MDGHQGYPRGGDIYGFLTKDGIVPLEALAPYLEYPRRTVIRNEAFVVVAAAMFFLQLILGPWRRRSDHWFVQVTLWIAYTVSFPLITYTLGQMVTSPVKNMLYPFWALILFWAAGCANALMAYSIEDNKQWKRYLFELLQYFVYLAFTLRLLVPVPSESIPSSQTNIVFIPLYVLMFVLLQTNFFKMFASCKVIDSRRNKLVADYMGADDQITAAQKETLTTTFDDDNVHFAYDLSQSLCCRYFDMDCAEAGLPEALHCTLEDLLPEEDQVTHYSGAFHVIEVELGFLYDLFFTKHAAIFDKERAFFTLVICKLILACICGVLLIVYPTILSTLNPIIEVATRRGDVTVTVVIMGALILFEVLQAIHYLTSDWATVSLTCSYTREDTSKLMPSILQLFRRFKLDNFLGRWINSFGYWRNKMGQSSVIGGNLLVNGFYLSTSRGRVVDHVLLFPVYNLAHSLLFPMKNFVAVPDLVKTYIVSCLRIYGTDGGSLANGRASLQRNGVFGDFSSTLENDSQITVMLIWHIATEYCNIATFNGAEEGLHQSDAQQVATTLSKYCAYLMYFLPELLAENSTDTLFIVHEVLEEVEDALGGDKPTKDRLLRVIQDSDGPDDHSTIIDIPPVSSNIDDIIHDSIGSNNTDNIVHDSSGSSNTDNIIHDSSGGNNMDNIIHDSSGGDNMGNIVHDSTGSDNTDNIIHNSSGRINNDHSPISQDSGTNDKEDSILVKGLKLGRDLEAKDINLRWKVLAELWAETIIYIAPSDKAAEHMERLAQGGEFLTHVWALLTHAGIVKRDHMMPTPDQTTNPEDRV